MENWVNLEGKYLHLVADMSPYDTDTVSVCSLGIFGTRYDRDEAIPTSMSVIQGKIVTITVPHIYSFYSIGNTIDINLR